MGFFLGIYGDSMYGLACISRDWWGSIWLISRDWWSSIWLISTVYPKKYAHGFCFAVLCCGYTLTDFPISIRLTSLALWQSNDCPSASKATLMNMDKYFMWIHYERLHNHNKAKHNKTVCKFLGYTVGIDGAVYGLYLGIDWAVYMDLYLRSDIYLDIWMHTHGYTRTHTHKCTNVSAKNSELRTQNFIWQHYGHIGGDTDS